MKNGGRLIVVALWAVLAAGAWSEPNVARAEFARITFSQLEAVTATGSSYWASQHPTTSLYPVELVGVVINKPSDMLNYTYDATTNSSPQMQFYVQALSSGGTYGGYTVAPGDYGGTAVYMRMKIPWASSQNYTEQEWADELTRVGASTLNVGDVVLIQAKSPGMDYNGKYNINEQHKKSSDCDFSITVLGQAEVAAPLVYLSSLKDTQDNFIFDATRETGCEHFQGSLVHLNNLQLTNPGLWGLGNTVTVTQDGRTFPLLLGLDSNLLAANPGTEPFNVTAILDQESGDYQAGYRLWLTSASMISAVPEPGALVLLVVAIGAGVLFVQRRHADRLDR